MGIPNAFAQVNFDAAGTAQTQTWVILSTGSLGQFVGVGEFAWSNVSEQTACALSGTSTMTLTGTLIYEA